MDDRAGDLRRMADEREAFWKAKNTKLFNAVVVSGAKWNPAGHMVLNVGGEGGWYFHVDKVYGNPTSYYSEEGFQAYLHTEGKVVLNRTGVDVPNPAGSFERLNDLMGRKWLWGVVPHNCVNFVETVVQAGGSSAGLYFNLPRFEQFR